jgi:hypothetical protein
MSSPGARLLPIAGAAVLILATVSGAAAAGAATSVTITSPRNGQSVSLKRSPYTAVAGDVAFSPTAATTTRFYLRRDGCGTSNDNPHLSVSTGTDAGDGCGTLFDAVGVGGDLVQSAFIDFPASDGMPLAFDAGRPISGVIALTGAQVGLAQVDVSLEALVNGEPVLLGSETNASAMLDPTGAATPVPFSMTPGAGFAGADVQALDLRVRIHGPNVYSGFVSLNGNSYVDLGSFASSVNKSVLVSLDDPSFANAVPARLEATGATWSVAIPTPAIGSHTLYARSQQGFDASGTASITFKVTK